MDLSALTSTLPPGLADAERELGDKFRAAALSITNLYKSGLSYTKQGYQVGYSACLADVLSTVQSSIGAGQDASQTLSRLMDWAEAREIAMAAFAADEDEPPNAPERTRQSTLAKQALHNLPRHTSAPLADHEVSTPSDSYSIRRISTPTVPESSSSSYQPTPQGIPSSPIVPTPPIPRASTTSARARPSPIRYSHRPTPLASSSSTLVSNSTVPVSSTFNPALPANTPQSLPAAGPQPAQNVQIGSKRPMVDTLMEVEEAGTVHSAPPVTPSGARGRAAKRRSMGLGKEDGEGRDGERRRGGRRHGHGGGGGGGGGGGQGLAG